MWSSCTHVSHRDWCLASLGVTRVATNLRVGIPSPPLQSDNHKKNLLVEKKSHISKWVQIVGYWYFLDQVASKDTFQKAAN